MEKCSGKGDEETLKRQIMKRKTQKDNIKILLQVAIDCDKIHLLTYCT